MKNRLIAIFLLLVTSNISWSGTSDSTMQATASINGSCLFNVDDLNFGDVTYQSMSGTGDALASASVHLLCTKNTNVAIRAGNGINGTSSGVGPTDVVSSTIFSTMSYTLANGSTVTPINDSVQDVSTYGAIYSNLNDPSYSFSGNTLYSQNETIDVSADHYYFDSSNNLAYQAYFDGGNLVYDGENGTELVSSNSNLTKINSTHIAQGERLLDANGNAIDLASLKLNGLTLSTQAAMASASNDKLPYSLSTDSNFNQLMNSTQNTSILAYTKNDGTYQTFPYYGKTNVKRAKPGSYVDTNTMTIYF